jgi:DHA1 family purine base/nucleoside efflux pump-like MFS transporter
LIESSPKTASIQQSLNNSALHLGVATGSFVGGMVIEHASINESPYAGSILILLSVLTIIVSFRARQTVVPDTEMEG